MTTTTLDRPDSMRETARATRRADRWQVVLLDDDDHTYDYVIAMLGDLFGHPTPTAFELAAEVDGAGKAVVWSGSREVAELGQERVHAYGPDPRISCCVGSMTAVLERNA